MRTMLPLLVAALAILAVAQAVADTDQLCLSGCINEGHSASVCMPQCTYNVKPKDDADTDTDTGDAAATNPYRVLDTLTPVQGTDPVTTPQLPAAQQAQLDRSCLETCLKKGLRYGLCTEHCTQQACPPDSVLCLNQRAAAQSDNDRGN